MAYTFPRNDCDWQERENGTWYTECGHTVRFDDAEAAMYDAFKYCPFCGSYICKFEHEKKVCGDCKNFIGGGDFWIDCAKCYGLCNSQTRADKCPYFEEK